MNIYDSLNKTEMYAWFRDNCGFCSSSNNCPACDNMRSLEGFVFPQNEKIIGSFTGVCVSFKKKRTTTRKVKVDKDQLSFFDTETRERGGK